MMVLFFELFENIVGKGENAHNVFQSLIAEVFIAQQPMQKDETTPIRKAF